MLTSKKEIENYIHPLAIQRVRPDIVIKHSDFDDIPALVAQTIHTSSESQYSWVELSEDKKEKKISSAKNWLNSEASNAMTPEMLNEIDQSGDVRSWMAVIKKLINST